MIGSKVIGGALTLPSGARFYRCALQVNPFQYLSRHCKPTSYTDETTYNNAIIQACKDEGVEVIGVTDHYRVRTSQTLIEAARDAGIVVFPGFEAVSKDGVHFLCLLEAGSSLDLVQAKISDCGVHSDAETSPIGKYDARELLDECRKWNSRCVAAHIAASDGLLRVLKGQTRAAVWKDPNLLACSLPGPVTDAPTDLRPILENKNPDYHRERPIAVINCQDVCDPSDLRKPGASCWIKMSDVSLEGLRQAFLDPVSRIRLSSDPSVEGHSELVAVTWETEGFLKDCAIHFNENLNVLVGGRGTGKSTVVESLRYVLQLDSIGEDARKVHEGIVRQVLRNGTKISLLVRSHYPDKRYYLIERTVPNPSIVRDEAGSIVPLTPRDVLPRLQVFGQHEIAELARSPEKLTSLLERFLEPDVDLAKRRDELISDLERSRKRLLGHRKDVGQVDERLAALPTIEETLKRYQEAGLEEKLKEQSLVVREESLLKTATERVSVLRDAHRQLKNKLPLDRSFLSDENTKTLPSQDLLGEVREALVGLETAATAAAEALDSATTVAEKTIASIGSRWEAHKRKVQESYEKTLRELQKSKIDGEEFIRLRRQVEELRPLTERRAGLLQEHQAETLRRRSLLAEWEDLKRQEFQRLERAAKRVTRQLAGRVQVRVTFAGNREPLGVLLKQIGGRLSEAIDALQRRPDLSLTELADACRVGGAELAKKYGLSSSQADRLAQADPEIAMQIEELDLPSVTEVQLNVAPEGEPPVWNTLADLSTGQKATAVLLLLLLESDAPLVVDQPEDDLDNRFITDGVVPRIVEEKRRRQFVFATHNANIPVLGDAELIVGLSAAGEAAQGHAVMRSEHMGSIDTGQVRDLVKEVLEGGQAAFEMRRLKYGF